MHKPNWENIDTDGVIDEWLEAGAVLSNTLNTDKAISSIIESYIARKRNALARSKIVQ
jgi:hypothetical protein